MWYTYMYISMSMRDASTFASESYRMCTDTFVLKTWVHGATHPGQRCAKGCAITILPWDLMGFDQPLTVARRCSRSGTWIFLKNFHAWRPGRCHQPCFWPSLEYGEGILGMLRYTSAHLVYRSAQIWEVLALPLNFLDNFFALLL